MDDDAMAASAAIAARVAEFYERNLYPPPADDLDAYERAWDDNRRRADSHLFWPAEGYRDDRNILVAGCGTVQAAHYAVRWPRARVVGVDVSEASITYERELQRKHRIENLELRQLPLERLGELDETFHHIVCTGVLHHLADPDRGLRALRELLAPNGAMHLMVYAPYGRAGVYMLQEYCRRLDISPSQAEISDLAETLKALPGDHPLAQLLRKSPDFGSEAGIADALLHPCDRAYSVAQFMEFLDGAGLLFGRWIRQAPYLPHCGAIAATPHAQRLTQLAPHAQYAELELFRGTMVRHSAVVYRKGSTAARQSTIDFKDDRWLDYVPIRMPDTLAIHDRLPPGAAAVLINRNHAFTDLYLPIDALQERLLEAIDGTRRIADMGRAMIDQSAARDFFQMLWRWDQIVMDSTRATA